MYEWLEEELKTIKNRKFHLVRGAAPILPGWKKKEIDWPVPPPPDFQRFLSQFGSTFLYRCSNSWYIRIFQKPYSIEDEHGSLFLCFGVYDSYRGMFNLESLQATGDSLVYMDRSRCFKGQSTFEQWIADHAAKARKKYTCREWEDIVKGSQPFSAEEEHVVRARKAFGWKIRGVTPDGELMIEVCNRSDMILPFLTFDVEIPGRNLVGGMYLPVSHVKPGETSVCTKMTYCRLANERDVKLDMAPDPWPEDREYYKEFKELSIDPKAD